ncbi:hypothetical protein DDB_G0276499 [Dictyostelium discoideum AX4]|uniref:Uncharacterized protein n=1 Tax=Dictyostelium discoideum TaxID=44689 RepID=Q551P9_DICDI|nr:hypothetical protein DDB_G0276499 [Dictyostelium discoideum AX4]EAL69203.1 hypothetical protein DDB_G0276499 [Dictyostelium discoideum AX4]|eukprot:XP_643121.1 hypothetical protein DDB_G0276499 [Dictyostelium discoideum AX4]
MIYKSMVFKYYKCESCNSNHIESGSSHSINYCLDLNSSKIYRNLTCTSFFTRPIFQSF